MANTPAILGYSLEMGKAGFPFPSFLNEGKRASINLIPLLPPTGHLLPPDMRSASNITIEITNLAQLP